MEKLTKLSALVELSRPINCLISFGSILLGGFLAGRTGALSNVLLAGASGAFITGGSNAINDLCDVETDRINKPDRPIPSGRVTERAVLLESVVLFVSGLILGGLINPKVLALAIVVSAGLILYSLRLTRTLFWGNFVVSLSAGLAFVYGGLSAGSVQGSLIPAGFAFLFHLGREMLKDAEDLEGDSAARGTTLPIRHGIEAAFGGATAAYGILIPLTFLPFFMGIYSWQYLAIVALGVNPVLIYVIRSMWMDSSRENLDRLNGILKADMFVGLAAILVGVKV